jgi:VanZ family protein
MALSQRQKLTTGALILYWTALFILTHIPIPQLVRKVGVFDLILHFVAYLILVYLLWFALNPDIKVNWRRASVWWVLVVLAGYGIVDELFQSCIPGRTCDVRDFAADLVGIFTGLILFSLFSFWPAFLITVGITIFALTNVARANLADLAPVINAIFHFFAYGFFTVVWIQNIYPFLLPKMPKARWFIVTLLPPTVFLIAVKLFSTILGKEFVVQDMVIAVAGIASAVFLVYLFGLVRKTHI